MVKRINKAIHFDYSALTDYDDVELLKFELTSWQASLLLSQIEFYGWSTRWKNTPANFDFLDVSERLAYRLMTPVECEAMELRWNNCILESSPDGINWTPIVGYDEMCFVSDGELSTAVDGLQAQITSNDADIVSLQSQITANDGDISNLINITNDHETRITALENASPASGGDGLYKLISSQVLQADGLFTAVDVSNYRYWRAKILALPASGASFLLNAVKTPAPTSAVSTLNSSSATVAYITGNLPTGRWTQVIAECSGSNFDDRAKSINVNFNHTVQQGSGQPYFTGSNAVFYGNEPIETINFAPATGNLLAGSMLFIEGIEDANSNLDLPELPSGQERIIVSFDPGGYSGYSFDTQDGYPLIVIGTHYGNELFGEYDAPNIIGSLAGLIIDIPSNTGIARIQVSYKSTFIGDFSGFESTQERLIINRLTGAGDFIEAIQNDWYNNTGHDYWTLVKEPATPYPSTSKLAISMGMRTVPSSAYGVFRNGLDSIVIDYTT